MFLFGGGDSLVIARVDAEVVTVIFNDEVPVGILDDWYDEDICCLRWAVVGAGVSISAEEGARVWTGRCEGGEEVRRCDVSCRVER